MIEICKCGHSRNLHTWSYAGGISKVENCKICFCKKFKKEQEK